MTNDAAQEKAPATEDDTSRSKLAFFVGWVGLPGAVILGLVGLGAHWGARHPDAWFVDLVHWIVGLFAS